MEQDMEQGRGIRIAQAVAALAAAFVFGALGLGFVQSNSQTSDEAAHLVAGYSYLVEGDFRLNPEHPPLAKLLAALPVRLAYDLPFEPDSRLWDNTWADWTAQFKLGRSFLYASPVPAPEILQTARLPGVGLGVLLVLAVGLWAMRAFGPGAGLTALALAALEPNLIAHAGLVTTDLALTLFSFLAFFGAWEYARAPSRTKALATGLALGLALASKHSALLVVAIVMASGALHAALSFVRDGTRSGPVAALLERARPLVWFALPALVVLPSAYFFRDFGAYVDGVSDVLFHASGGHPAFFLGERSSVGWLAYFVVAFAIKTPVGTLVLLGASLLGWRRGRPFGSMATFALLPAILFLAVASLAGLAIGLRHVLPIYPLLIVVASRSATLWPTAPRARVATLTIALALTAFESLRAAPYQLAFFNLAVGGPERGHAYLSDSNLDWGQGLVALAAFLEEDARRAGEAEVHLSYFGSAPPAAWGVRAWRAPGAGQLTPPVPLESPQAPPQRTLLAVSVTNVQGINADMQEAWGWLGEREPVARPGIATHVHDLTDDAEGLLQLARTYASHGRRGLARRLLARARAADPEIAGASELARSLEGF